MATSTLKIGRLGQKKTENLIPEMVIKYREELKTITVNIIDKNEKIKRLQKEIDEIICRRELVMTTINTLQGVK